MLQGRTLAILAMLFGMQYVFAYAADDEIVLGQSAVLSGPLAAAPDAYAAGDAYIKQINARGGVHGRKLRVVRLDDAYDPKRTAANVSTLLTENNAFAITSLIGTGATIAALGITEKAGVPLIGPYTGADALRDRKYRHLFFLRASYGDEVDKITQHLATTGVKSIALIYQDDAFGKAGLKVMNDAMARSGLKAAATGAFDITKMNVKDATDPVLKAQPNAVVLFTAGNGAIGVIKELLASPEPPQIFCLSVVQIDLLNRALGPQARGIVVAQVTPSPNRSSLPLIREYQQVMRSAGFKEYTYGSLSYFITTKVLVEALRRTGRDLTREKFTATLDGLRDYDMGGLMVDFNPATRSGLNFVDLGIVGADGRFMQ